MAISFSRPDPASPASVSSAQFPTSRRGYDQAEVSDFLRMVAAEQARLQERERHLERELRALQQSPAPAVATIDEETALRLLGEEAARVLSTAREAAAQIRVRAEEGSARLLREATDEAQRLREEAEIEAARRRQDATADSEAELQMAKQQGRDMVNEARAYRERVLSELARRRELARQQIEQLIHGRDRLLQAFERSRMAAVEVMNELTPLGEPAEYVNLLPITGPVPVMVPPRPVAATRLVDVSYAGAVFDQTNAGFGLDGDDALDPAALTAAVEGADDDRGHDAGDDADDDADNTVVLTLAPPLEPEPESDQAQVVLVEAVVDPTESFSSEDLGLIASLSDASDGLLMSTEPVQDVAEPGSDAAQSEDPEVASATLDNVRELFASTEQAATASAEPGSVDVEGVRSVETEDDQVPAAPLAPSGGSVDDLFARLRAASAEAVVHKVNEQNATLSVDADPVQAIPPTSDPDEVVVPLIVSVARKLKRVLADEQNELLDTLRRKEPVRGIEALVQWESDHSDRYAAAVEGELMIAALAGAKGSEDGRDPAIVRSASDAVTNDIVAPLRERLARCIDKADGNNAEIATQVRALYRDWKSHRIDEHVEAIVRLAYDRGALTVAKS